MASEWEGISQAPEVTMRSPGRRQDNARRNVAFGIVALFSIAVCAGIMGWAKFSTWRSAPTMETFNCEEGRFSVVMPSNRKRAQRKVNTQAGDLTEIKYTALTPPFLYQVAYADFPNSNAVFRYNVARDDLVHRLKGTVIGEEHEMKLDGFPVHELEVEANEPRGHVIVRLCIAKGRIHELMVAGPDKESTREKARPFFSSFRFIQH